MKILIVGAGIAGLSTAILCDKYGIEFDIIEKTAAPSNLGFLIFLHGPVQKQFAELGIADEIANHSQPFKYYDFLNAKGNLAAECNFHALDKKYGESISIERNALHTALVNRLGLNKIKFSTTVKDLTEIGDTDSVKVDFSNGESQNYDLVVGADGINSSIRSLYFNAADVMSYKWYSMLFWLEAGFEIPKGIRHYIGHDKYFVLYPHGTEKCVAYFGMRAVDDGQFLDPEYFLRQFTEFKDVVPAIIESLKPKINETKILTTPIRHIETHEWYRGKVVIIGDAEHGVSPIIGMGSTMAIQDASVLVDELRRNSVEQSLKNFVIRRNPIIFQMKLSATRAMNFMDLISNRKYLPFVNHPLLLRRVLPRLFLRINQSVLKLEI